MSIVRTAHRSAAFGAAFTLNERGEKETAEERRRTMGKVAIVINLKES